MTSVSSAGQQPASLPRRLVNAVRAYGVIGALSALRRKLRQYWRDHQDGAFDRKHGTDTGGRMDVAEFGIDNSKGELIWYQPVGETFVHRALDRLKKPLSAVSLVDYGSGKGRVLLVSSDYGFKSIIGIEIVEELHKIAERNIAIYGAGNGMAGRMQSLCADATTYVAPDGPAILFFFAPFKGEPMERTIATIAATRADKPTALILYGGSPDNFALFDGLGWHSEEISVPRNNIDGNPYRMMLYANDLAKTTLI